MKKNKMSTGSIGNPASAVFAKTALVIVVLLTLIIALRQTIPAYASESSESSDSQSAGQSLYDALRAIYGNSGTSTTGSSSSATSSSGSNTNQNNVITTDDLMKSIDTEAKGPEVNEVSLGELYHEEYSVYEETLNDIYTIYTTVRNGTITNRPVMIDIPEGVGFYMKKDGADYDYDPDDLIEEEGSYVLFLYVMDSVDDINILPFSEQTVSRAKFRFRIQYSQGVHGVLATDGTEEEEEIPLAAEEAPEEDAEIPEETDLPEDMLPDDYVYDESAFFPDEEVISDNSAGEREEFNNPLFTTAYDDGSGFYTVTLLSGESFYTNVPNGMLTNEAVSFQNDGNLNLTLYRNGEPVEDFDPSDFVRQAGNYSLVISSDSPDFQNAYGGSSPVYRFRIFSAPVNDAQILYAPEGAAFTRVRMDGVEMERGGSIRDDVVYLEEDGEYELSFTDMAGSHEVRFVLDTFAPVVTVAEEPNLATIGYYGNVSRCELYRGKELVSDTEVVEEVTRSGRYTLYAYDEAGNVTDMDFQVQYRINVWAVISIIALLAIIGGITFYVLRIRKKVKVV